MPEKVNNEPQFGVDDYLKEMYPKPEKTITYTHKTHNCKWCGKAWETERSNRTHEIWCDNNPESKERKERSKAAQVARWKQKREEEEGRKEENPLRLNLSKPKTYTIEDIREIDKIIGLTDDQIAKFVRGEKKE